VTFLGFLLCSLCGCGTEIVGPGRAQEEIADHDEKDYVGNCFLNGMEGADPDVKGKPGKQEPACPIVTEEQKNAADDSEKANGGNEHEVAVVGRSAEVIHESHQTDCNEKKTAKRDWPGSLHDDWTRILRGRNTMVQHYLHL
jgi:hypothetical protein